MRHIVSVSSGIGSAFTWKLIIDKYGSENVTGVFCDVNGEHPDNYRFLADVQYELGGRLVKIGNEGRTIWDVMIESRFLANTRIDVCSRVLKRQAFRNWLNENCVPEETVVYLGIDWTEIARLDKARPHWAEAGYRVESPLCEPPYYHKSDAQTWLDEVGIARPALYDMGFSHANCGGGCVKAGIGHFIRLLELDRKWYIRWWETGEERVRAYLRKDVSILRDRAGGTVKPLTLRTLRERVESGDRRYDRYRTEDLASACGVCFLGEESGNPDFTKSNSSDIVVELPRPAINPGGSMKVQWLYEESEDGGMLRVFPHGSPEYAKITRRKDFAGEKGTGNFENQLAAYRELWPDAFEDAKIAPAKATAAQVRELELDKATVFEAGTEDLVPLPGGPKAAGERRPAKRDLANRVVALLATMFDTSTGDEPWRSAYTEDEARQCVANWVHHLPAYRDEWPEGLPFPERSNWK